MVTIIDYGVGNLASVQNMLKRCGVDSQISNNSEVILRSSKLILPGVGAYDAAMEKINELGLYSVIREAAYNGIDMLGICLGAQLLLEGSEEGILNGLSLIKGKCKKFNEHAIAPLRVPHMGWNDVHFVAVSHPLAYYEEADTRFYFTHSYYLHCNNQENILATSFYGHEFTCGIVDKNIMGVQFHPEKSHIFGKQLLTNFINM
jgi:glutamine amidotransferase